jgi:outer membrane biosynthesis protein TonB
VGGSIQPPRLLAKPNESLPPSAERRSLPSSNGGYIGKAIIWVVIDRLGAVRYPRIVRGLGDEENKRALDEVTTWKFAPAMKEGEAVAVEAELVIRFE